VFQRKKNLWPSHLLSSGSSELTGPEESESDGAVLTSGLQEAIAELCEKGSAGPTIADISNWLAGGVEENLQFMTDEQIINNVLENNSQNEQESSTPPIIRTVQHDNAMSALNVCYKWAEENNVQAEDILTLKRLQEKVLKEASRIKRQNAIDASFVKKKRSGKKP
jgi:hypothetical protein